MKSIEYVGALVVSCSILITIFFASVVNCHCLKVFFDTVATLSTGVLIRSYSGVGGVTPSISQRTPSFL